MAKHFILLDGADSGRPTAINPENVGRIEPFGKDLSMIHMASGHIVTVIGNFKEVTAKLEK